MNQQAKQVLAFIFKRSGKQTLPASDVYLAISMELQWCSPKQAKIFVKQAVNEELLIQNDHGVSPSFDIDNITIPTGFKPSKECFLTDLSAQSDTSEDNVISKVYQRLINKKNMTKEEINHSIETIANEKMIEKSVAAIFLAKKMNCKVSDLIPHLK